MKTLLTLVLLTTACIDHPIAVPMQEQPAASEVVCPPGDNVCYAVKIVAEQNCEHKNSCAASGTGTSEPLDQCVARYVGAVCAVADCSAPYTNWDHLNTCTGALWNAGCSAECFP
jgi:hypothetical protein